MKAATLKSVDPLIRPAVEILSDNGFKTVESCQGGEGHALPDPIVYFEGEEFDIIRAYEVCLANNLNVLEGRRIYSKCTDVAIKGRSKQRCLPQTYEAPVNAIVFMIHAETNTIFFPH